MRSEPLVKIAVLGATGRLGQLLVTFAVDTGHDIFALARTPGRYINATGRTVTVVQADATDPASLTAAIAGIDVVLNGLGVSRKEDPAVLMHAADAFLAAQVPVVIWPGRLGTGATSDVPTSFILKLTEAELSIREKAEDLVRSGGGTVIHTDKFGRGVAGKNRALVPAEGLHRGLSQWRFQREDLAILMINESLAQQFAGRTAAVAELDSMKRTPKATPEI